MNINEEQILVELDRLEDEAIYYTSGGMFNMARQYVHFITGVVMALRLMGGRPEFVSAIESRVEKCCNRIAAKEGEWVEAHNIKPWRPID
jgi:hypothetical protein